MNRSQLEPSSPYLPTTPLRPLSLAAFVALLLLGQMKPARAAELAASDDTGLRDNVFHFGYALSLSGDAGMVGSLTEKKVYLYRDLTLAAGTVTENLQLSAPSGENDQIFGGSVSLSGSRGLVGFIPGYFTNQPWRVYLYEGLDQATGTLKESAQLVTSSSYRPWEQAVNVKLTGNLGVVGAFAEGGWNEEYHGAAYVYRDLDAASGLVTEKAKLTITNPTAYDYFGQGLSLSDTSALVGAPGKGMVYLYRHLDTVSGVVTEDATLVPAQGARRFAVGYATSLSGSTALVGAFGNSSSLEEPLAAYLYRDLDTAKGVITENAKLVSSNGAYGDSFGAAVSLSGDNALVGAYAKEFGGRYYQGAVYLFTNLGAAVGTVQEQVMLTASSSLEVRGFGYALSLDGDRFLIGAPFAVAGAHYAGTAYTGSVRAFTTFDAGAERETISRLSFVSQGDWIIGQTTSGNVLTLSAGDQARVMARGKGVFIGQQSGVQDNVLAVEGTVTTREITISSPGAGPGNRLKIGSSGRVVAKNITVNRGGTLALGGDASKVDRIARKTTITLAGGTLSMGGVSEGQRHRVGLGALRLKADSVIDLGYSPGVLHFAGSAGLWTPQARLMVYHWNRNSQQRGFKSLLFGRGRRGLTPTQIRQIYFYSDAGQTLLGPGGSILQDGEILPWRSP